MYKLTISHVQRDDDGRAFRMGKDESVMLDDSSAWQPRNEGDLFRLCQREYGRCIGRVYWEHNIPSPVSGKTVITDRHGWVFQRRERYEDAHRVPHSEPTTFLHETWVMWKLVLGDSATAA